MKIKPLPFKLSPYCYIILREASYLVALLLDVLNLNKIFLVNSLRVFQSVCAMVCLQRHISKFKKNCFSSKWFTCIGKCPIWRYFCNLSVLVVESMQGNLIGLGVFVSFENFSLIWKRYHYRRRIAKFDHAHWAVRVFLTCHIYCDTGHPFISVISDLLPNVWQWSYHYLFYDLDLSLLGFEQKTYHMRGERSNRLSPPPLPYTGGKFIFYEATKFEVPYHRKCRTIKTTSFKGAIVEHNFPHANTVGSTSRSLMCIYFHTKTSETLLCLDLRRLQLFHFIYFIYVNHL